MAHPRTDDDDPVLRRLRALALAFPGATETRSHGRPTFRAGKVFAWYGMGEKDVPHPRSVAFTPEEDDRDALEHDPRFFRPAYLGPSGWLGLDLDGGPGGGAAGHGGPGGGPGGPGVAAGPGVAGVDWQEVAELLDSSYRAVAAPALLARLEAEGSPAGRPTTAHSDVHSGA